MKTESQLIDFIENYPYAANFKEGDTGKYIFNNTGDARRFGIQNPMDLQGLTIKDLTFSQSKWGAQFAKMMAELDLRAHESKSAVLSKHPFLDDKGEVQFEEVIKSPVLGQQGNILGVASYRRDITNSLSYRAVYDLYRALYGKPEAIKRMLDYLSVEQYFVRPPTEAPLRVFLAKAERCHADKEIAQYLGISHRTVEWQTQMLSNCVVDGNLARVLSLVKRKNA